MERQSIPLYHITLIQSCPTYVGFSGRLIGYYHLSTQRIVSLLMLTITFPQATTLHIHTYTGLYRIMVMEPSVVGVKQIINIVPRAGIEPTSLTFGPRVLTISPCHHATHDCLSMWQLASEFKLLLVITPRKLSYQSF